jgi:hypothetical protein
VFRDFAPFPSFKHYEAVSAVLYFPYTVSLMSMFELYGMNMPIFTPSLEYAVALELRGEGMVHRYGVGHIEPNAPMKGFSPPPFPPSPGDTSYDAVRYWLNKSDFMVFPHVQHFDDDSNDLMRQLCDADFDGISESMRGVNDRLLDQAKAFWRDYFLYGRKNDNVADGIIPAL